MVLASAPAYVATREALTVLSPQDLTTARFLASAALLGLYLLATRQRLHLRRRDLPRMLLVGVCGYGAFGLLLSFGQTTVPAGTTSLLLNISPVFAFVLGYFVLIERTTKWGYFGMAIAVVGVGIIALGDTSATGFNGNALLIVAAALLLSIFLILQQPLFVRIPPLEVVFWGCTIGGLLTLPVATFDAPAVSPGASFWIAIAVLVGLSTVVGYSMWNLTLARTSVAEGGSLLLVVPIFSVLLGWLMLGEIPNLAAILGGTSALIGVVMLSQATSRRTLAGPALLTGVIPTIEVLTGAIPIIGLPRHHEEVAEITLPSAVADQLTEIALAAATEVGAQLVTISLWRATDADLVRVYSSRPHVYQVGGISADLEADWVRQCIVNQESFLGGDETVFGFEHAADGAPLTLAAAVNAVVAADGEFLGCLNFLDAPGAYSAQSMAAADEYASRLIPILRQLRPESSTVGER